MLGGKCGFGAALSVAIERPGRASAATARATKRGRLRCCEDAL